MRLLFVEDEQDLNEVTTTRLRHEGFTVDAVLDGRDAIDYIDAVTYDLYILDIMLPGMSGLDILKRVRQLGDGTPVLLLTARDAIEDRVAGLNSGADDYLVKPFHFDELVARIRALLRREPLTQKDNTLEAAGLHLDLDTMLVDVDGQKVGLTTKEFALLEVLMRHPGQILSRDQIEQSMYDLDFDGASNVIDVYIRYLRKKIDDSSDVKRIHTVRGAGYVLREEPKG